MCILSLLLASFTRGDRLADSISEDAVSKGSNKPLGLIGYMREWAFVAPALWFLTLAPHENRSLHINNVLLPLLPCCVYNIYYLP